MDTLSVKTGLPSIFASTVIREGTKLSPLYSGVQA